MRNFSLPTAVRAMIPSKRLIGVFQGIAPATAAKQTVVLQVTAAWNYVDTWLKIANLTTAMISEIRLKIGGSIIQRWDSADLDLRLQYDNQPAFATYSILKIPMRRMGIRGGMSLVDPANGIFVAGSARDLAEETTLNCGSAGGGFSAIKDVQIELDVINTGALQPAVSLYARVTPPWPGGPGLLYRVDKQTKAIVNGTVTITKSEMGVDALRPFLNRITIVNPAPGVASFDDFLLRYNNNDWWQIDAALLGQGAAEDNLRDVAGTAANLTVLDFQEQGFGDEVLDLSSQASDILLQFTAAGLVGAANLTYYVETLGLPFAQNAG